MADTLTTNLSLTKPEPGASADSWGGKLNNNFDDLDSLFDAGPYLKVTKGGTGAGTASGARTNLGLGSDATGSNLSSLTNAATARTNLGVSASGVLTSSWTVTESGGVLYFAYSGTNKAKLDSSGNLTVIGNITAYGTM